MKKLPLTQGKFALVDNEDYGWLSKWKWTYMPHYARRSIFLGNTSKPRTKSILMHRLIMQPPEGMIVDHIDGNGLNNQRSNMRLCTHAQNHYNTKAPKNSTSGYKGINWHKQRNKWRVRVSIKGKEIHIGMFKNISLAIDAYNRASRKYHGDFARLNKLGG